MRAHRTESESIDVELDDLDALVLAEIESISGRVRSNGVRPMQDRAQPRSTPTPGELPRRRSRAAVAPIQGRKRQETPHSGEDAEGLFDEPFAVEAPDPERDEAPPIASLLTPEEDAFITRAVGFLTEREHADMILGQIWEALTEQRPDGFFEAPMAEDVSPGPEVSDGPQSATSAGDGAPQ